MKLLLTSAGIKNASIQDALVELLGKPIAESNALCIPTAAYGHPRQPGRGAGGSSADRSPLPMCELGWKSLGVLELTALPSIDEEQLGPLGPRRPTSCWWMAATPCTWLLDAAVRAGGPLAVAARDGLGGTERREHGDDPRIGEDFVNWKPPTGGDERWAWSTSRSSRTWITRTCRTTRWPTRKDGRPDRGPAYAIDDETAIKVVDGTVEVVSEGHWKLFTPDA